MGQEWDWSGSTPQELFEWWESSVARSQSLVTDALAEDGLAFVSRQSWPDGPAPSLRWIVCHLIEEYARHNGHADLIRESVDGSVGE